MYFTVQWAVGQHSYCRKYLNGKEAHRAARIANSESDCKAARIETHFEVNSHGAKARLEWLMQHGVYNAKAGILVPDDYWCDILNLAQSLYKMGDIGDLELENLDYEIGFYL